MLKLCSDYATFLRQLIDFKLEKQKAAATKCVVIAKNPQLFMSMTSQYNLHLEKHNLKTTSSCLNE